MSTLTRAPIERRTTSHDLPLWRVNLLRAGYLVFGLGLAIVKWPLLFDHEPWELNEGTVEVMLIAMSLLAGLGLRYPVKMLPLLLFEVAWKLLWLGVVALPLWLDGELEGATRVQATEVLWVVVIMVAIPWRHVFNQYVVAAAEPMLRQREVAR